LLSLLVERFVLTLINEDYYYYYYSGTTLNFWSRLYSDSLLAHSGEKLTLIIVIYTVNKLLHVLK